ncbi:MAG: PAS domain-containing protein [Chloroflexi bacterium]|nr:PAS domain-containing protein [Chloroflexota bacterium]
MARKKAESQKQKDNTKQETDVRPEAGDREESADIVRPEAGDREESADISEESVDTSKKDAEPQAAQEEGQEPAFPIVGIGASAGGLEAFEKFFTQMPPDSGMAFVLVQHLSSPHKSILDDLVQRLTRMKVHRVSDGIEVEPNCAYIIPPNKDMALLHGKLHLMEPGAPRGLRLPIDFFFRSLAQDQREQAICIVLSGTGSDGTLGLKAIKGEGGMAMAQDTQSAKYDGMPRSAISTGLVDYILPPDEMPQQLMTYVEHALGKGARPAVAPVPETTDSLQKIFILLRAQTGHDFSYYKQNTIRRRIERRMAVNQIERLNDYVRYLQQNPLEVETLFREILIGVTNFFRDPEAFEMLEETVLPSLLEKRPPDHAVRIWIPGCSTGEEAYSITMLLREQMDTLRIDHKVQVFATDIDGDAIEKARAGIYPDGIVADVSPERLARFFVQDEDGNTYQIKKSIRDMVVFAEQNVIDDPPFSKMDLISCRNLLIYLQPQLQKRVLPLFHYSLKANGVLFLGNSESVGEFVDLFGTIDRKWKLYRRKGDVATHRPLITFPRPPFMDDIVSTRAGKGITAEKKISVRELAEKSLLQHYTPACAIVNEKADVLYIHGRTGKYLEPAPGEASLNILRMAREGVRLQLTTAIRKVIAQKTPVHYAGLEVRTNGDRQTINLTVRPVLDPPSMQGLIMVLFEDVTPENRAEIVKAAGEPVTDTDRRIADLERELRAKEEYLQTTVEELETSNEELKSTNEELQSSNEELQSTNEELETSKEELQSVNEELVTVNTELQGKLDELSRANNDMNNLLAGTGVGTIFLDHQLCIQRFTPAATQVIHLIQSDVGRPIGHIASNLVDYDSLVQDAQSVLDSLIPVEAQVQTTNEQWYLMRILPYRTVENVIEGTVITFVEITELKQLQDALQKSKERFRVALEGSNIIVSHIDRDLRYTWIHNPHPDFDSSSALGKRDDELAQNEGTTKLVELKKRVIETGVGAQTEITFALSDGDHIYDVVAEPLTDSTGQMIGATTVSLDITKSMKEQERLGRLAIVVRDSNDAITVQDFEGNIMAWNPGAERMYGWSEAEALAMNIRDIVPEKGRENALAFVQKLVGREIVEPFEAQRITKSGAVLDVWLTGTVLVNENREPYAVATTERDVSRRDA